MRDEVWLVWCKDPALWEPELHIICSSVETAQKYIDENSDRDPDDYRKEHFKVEKHQVY